MAGLVPDTAPTRPHPKTARRGSPSTLIRWIADAPTLRSQITLDGDGSGQLLATIPSWGGKRGFSMLFSPSQTVSLMFVMTVGFNRELEADFRAGLLADLSHLLGRQTAQRVRAWSGPGQGGVGHARGALPPCV